MMSTGNSSWNSIEDEWDFPRLEHWLKYCEEEQPPLPMMFKAHIGMRKKKVVKLTEDNFADFVKTHLGPSGALSG